MADDDSQALPTPSNTDDVPPATIRKPDDTAPADSTPEDKEEQALKDQREHYAQMQADLVTKMHDLDAKFKSQGDPLVNDIYANLANIGSTPAGQLDSLSAEYRQEMAKNTQEHGTVATAGLFTLLGMGLMLFGRKRGWGARAGIWAGMGNAMKYYAQGKEEQSRDQQAKALKMISLVHQENQERLAQQREVLADKRLTVQQQMDLLKTHHEVYQEQMGSYKGEQEAIAGETKIIQQKEQALQAMRRLRLKFHTDISHILKTKDAKSWAEFVRVTSKGEINPERSDEDLAKAEELYPLEDYIRDRKDVGKTDEKGKEKVMPTTSSGTKKTPDQEIQDKAKSWWSGQ